MYRKTVKPILGYLATLLAVLVLSPVLIGLCLAVKLDSKGPVFFRQKRVGRDKKHFMILKFRTMKIDAPHDVPTHLLEDPEQYITRVGKFLRKTSLDELPQLFNILMGQMAVVGPRPALWNQYDLIEARDAYGVNALTPGVTGWAQIHGRDELSIPDKASMDGYYAQHISLPLDIKCIFLTAWKVVKREGVVEGKASDL